MFTLIPSASAISGAVISEKLREHEDLALGLVQLAEHLGELLQRLGGDGLLVRPGRAIGHVQLERDAPALAPLAPPVVARDVEHDPEEPGPLRGAPLEAGELSVDGQEHVLRGVLDAPGKNAQAAQAAPYEIDTSLTTRTTSPERPSGRPRSRSTSARKAASPGHSGGADHVIAASSPAGGPACALPGAASSSAAATGRLARRNMQRGYTTHRQARDLVKLSRELCEAIGGKAAPPCGTDEEGEVAGGQGEDTSGHAEGPGAQGEATGA